MKATLLAALLLTLFSTADGEAQVSEARMEDYRAEAGAGVEAFNAGDMATARAAFERAARILPNPRVYRLLGRVAVAEEKWVEATQLFHRALTAEDAGHPLSERLRQEVENELLPRAREHVAEYTLDLQPAEAIVQVDGAAVELVGQLLILTPGAHTLVADAPGHETTTQQLSSQGGDREVLRVHLTEAPAPAPDPTADSAPSDSADWDSQEQPAPTPESVEDGDEDEGGMSTGSLVGAIALGAAGLAGLGAAIAGMAGGGCIDTNAAGMCIEEDQTAWGPVAAYGGLGLVAIAGAIVWLIVGGSGDEESNVTLRGSTVRWQF